MCACALQPPPPPGAAATSDERKSKQQRRRAARAAERERERQAAIDARRLLADVDRCVPAPSASVDSPVLMQAGRWERAAPDRVKSVAQALDQEAKEREAAAASRAEARAAMEATRVPRLGPHPYVAPDVDFTPPDELASSLRLAMVGPVAICKGNLRSDAWERGTRTERGEFGAGPASKLARARHPRAPSPRRVCTSRMRTRVVGRAGPLTHLVRGVRHQCVKAVRAGNVRTQTVQGRPLTMYRRSRTRTGAGRMMGVRAHLQ
jgi:hypothetical protein